MKLQTNLRTHFHQCVLAAAALFIVPSLGFMQSRSSAYVIPWLRSRGHLYVAHGILKATRPIVVRLASGGALSDDDLFGDSREEIPAPRRGGDELKPGNDGVSPSDSFYGARTPFSELGISDTLVKRLASEELHHSTAIQALAIPPIMSGKDVLLAAETGSGKTLAYLLPILEALSPKTNEKEAVEEEEEDTGVAPQPLLLAKMKVAELRMELEKRSLDASGLKADLQQRLQLALDEEEPPAPPPPPVENENSLFSTDSYFASDEREGKDSFLESKEDHFRESVPRVLVLTANRELISQVLAVASPLLVPDSVSVGAALTMASSSWPYSIHQGQIAPEVLVCTPTFAARYAELLLADLEILVLDEADMLLDGSFLNQVDQILVARKRVFRTGGKPAQVVLAAATVPNYGLKSVELELAKRFPDLIRVETGLLHHTQPQLDQDWLYVDESDPDAQFACLERLLKESQQTGEPDQRTMVFVNTARVAQDLTEKMVDEGMVGVCAYHKNVPADDRAEALRSFSGPISTAQEGQSTCRTLVCTDLAARGLDLPDVDHVIQYDFATNVVQHVHRLGRTGRAGKLGRASHLVSETGPSRELADMIKDATERGVPLEESFSRKRGFRKKIKKTGKPYNARANLR